MTGFRVKLKNNRGKIFLLTVFLLAFFLRFYKLGEIPPGAHRDEASSGYNAYSILKTGKDEYGKSFPLVFKAFGDFKRPINIYLTSLAIPIFGLNELSVRAPIALIGTLTVILIYFLVKELFSFTNYALLSAALLAISPWHIHLSRVESESNLAVFFITLAVLFFLKAVRGRTLLLIPSSILFALTYYTYHGNHIFTTLLLGGLLLIYNKEILRTKTTFIGVLIFLIMVGFILSKTLVSADRTKLAGISIFGDPAVVHTKIELPRNEPLLARSIFLCFSTSAKTSLLTSPVG